MPTKGLFTRIKRKRKEKKSTKYNLIDQRRSTKSTSKKYEKKIKIKSFIYKCINNKIHFLKKININQNLIYIVVYIDSCHDWFKCL